MLQVVFSLPARADLQDITDYIAENNPERAISFVGELERFCRSMGDFPHLGRSCEDMGFPTFRRFPYGNYVVFYRIKGEAVDILRILHGAMDAQTQIDL